MQDGDELNQKFDGLRDLCDQIHFGWINERWIVTQHLKEVELAWNFRIKLIQRRPGSNDKVGLDHLDFYSAQNTHAEKVLKDVPKAHWTHETNNEHCSWISVWFDTTEAKLRTDSVLGPCIVELKEMQDQVLIHTIDTSASSVF